MLLGVLRMPINLWSDLPINKMQRHGRYIQAADEIVSLREQLAKTKNQLAIEQECYEKNAADSLDSLAECSVENEKLREQLTHTESKVISIASAIKKCFPNPAACCDSTFLVHMDDYNNLVDVVNNYRVNTTIDKG